MKSNISEDLPARKFAPAASSDAAESGGESSGGNMEKRAKQCVYDARYQVRKEMKENPGSKMDPASVTKAVLEKIYSSEYPQPIKMRAEKIVMGENQVKEMKEFASQNVARALYSVFVEQPSRIIDEEYIEELKRELSEADQSPEERKYKVRVTDKDTGNSYIRMANRSKINELRANPNIVSVEMLDLYGSPEPSESERTRGAQTASVAAGKGLKNNDGNLANNYPPYNKVTRGDVIAGATGKDQMGGKKKVKEEFIGEKDNGDKNKQIKPLGPKEKNTCVKVYNPFGTGRDSGRELMMHQELEGEMIAETGYTKFLKKVHSLQEKAVSQNQQQLAAMALEYLDGNMPDASDAVKQMAKMGRKELKKFARTSHKGLPEKVKEEMDYDDKKKKSEEPGCEDDPRAKYAEREVIKNRLRASLGIKNPIVMTAGYNPEGDVIDELTRFAKETGKKFTTGRSSVEGGNPQIRARVKKEPWLKYGGSREEPKVPGKKPPKAGEPGSERQSPEHMVKSRRGTEERAREQRPGSRHD